MSRDPHYDILFDPVRIGPVTAPNRFYQVPHCSGMGYRRPRTLSAMREVKAEGGWGVVCTEYCSIHPTSDDEPLPSSSLWDDEDVRAQAEMVDAVHRHGALAGVELWHGGGSAPGIEDIRECIGCNICSAYDRIGVPIRCTQNPAIGEEWRRDWHPERIEPKASERSVLVVGGGPAGLEAARALGQRGYRVTLAEATKSLGGRVSRESALPTLAEWARVRDWRLSQLDRLDTVKVFLDSRLDAEQILEFGADRVALATGAAWRRTGVGRWHSAPIPGHDRENVLSADDVLDGARPEGHQG